MKGHIFIGTWAASGGEGILAADWNETTGSLSRLRLAAAAPNPTFLAAHPSKPVLYAVNETADFQGMPGGGLTTFSVGDEGSLQPLSAVPAGGRSPTHLEVSSSGDLLALAIYHGPGIAVFALDLDGLPETRLCVHEHAGSSIHPTRQTSPHPHAAHFHPSGRALLAPDLGTDRIAIYEIPPAAAGAPIPAGHWPSQPGSGPRHLAFHPHLNLLYAVNELDSTIDVLGWNPIMLTLQTGQRISLLPAGFEGVSTAAEVAVHPSGKFLYASNRGADNIALFAVKPDGDLRLVDFFDTGGGIPRHFALSPSGKWLVVANQGGNSLVIFEIHPQTGALTRRGQHAVAAPSCVLFFLQ